MTNTDTRDVPATVEQMRRLESAGCDLVRVAVPDRASAEALTAIKSEVGIPVVADIHFDHRLALAAIEHGADKLRLNPGNITEPEKIKGIADKAGERGIPIRIGVNSGSLDRDRYGPPTPEALVKSALDEIELLESRGFRDIVVSLKSFDVADTINSYRLLAEHGDYPLHLGVTEAGLPLQGTVRSAVGIGTLLADGIGDTLRVSLTARPEAEVRVGVEILKCLNLREQGFTIISCPTCARCSIDVIGIAGEVARRLEQMDGFPPMKVAVMGCVVNGPGEAKDADAGVAGAGDGGMIFAEGVALRKVKAARMVDELMDEVRRVGERLRAEGCRASDV